MESRRIPVTLELDTDLPVEVLRVAANYTVNVTVDGVTHMCAVAQAQPNAIRQPKARATSTRKKSKRYTGSRKK